LAEQVQEAILELAELDREILMLRQIEELSNAEAAEALHIEPATARKRLGRAMIRLSEVLTQRGIQLDEQ
jgi:RNA polymerase sigma-70 factor (ECF subfamily)